MPKFRDWVATRTAATVGDDADEVYWRDDSGDVSQRSTWGAVKAALATIFAPINDPTFTGDVQVPDADADGEALAFGQSGAELAELLIDNTEPTVEWRDAGPSNERRFRVRHNNGVTDFSVLNDDGSVRHGWLTFDAGSGGLDVSGASAVVVPDAAADGEAVNKGQMDAADALKAPINDPTFTGNVVVPAADCRQRHGRPGDRH